MGKEFKRFLGWDTQLHLPPTLTFLIEGTWILPGGSVSTYWRWYHLSALAVISCLIDFCLSLLQLAPCHRHHCFASVCLCFIGLLIVPSIFFKEVDRLASDSSVFLWFYSQQDGCLKSLEFLSKWPVCKPLLPHYTKGCYKFFIAKYGIVDKSLPACVEVQEGANIWPTDNDKTASDCFSRCSLWELSNCCTNRAMIFPRYPSRAK